MNKEKIIIEYIKNYLKYYEKNTYYEEDKIIFFMIRKRIKEIEKLNEEKLKIINENMKKQAEE